MLALRSSANSYSPYYCTKNISKVCYHSTNHTSRPRCDIFDVLHFDAVKEHVDKNSLLICDIDDTIIEPETWLGSSEWFNRERKRFLQQGSTAKDALKKALHAWNGVQYFITPKLVEPNTDKIIRKLQRDSFHVMGLTTRSAEVANRTISMLKEVKVDFAKSAPAEVFEALFFNPEVVLYKNGILFTSGTAKGKALFKLLPKIQEQFSKVIYINDDFMGITDVGKKCKELNVEFIGLRYGFTDMQKLEHNHAAAQIQFTCMKNLMSNTAAEESLRHNFCNFKE